MRKISYMTCTLAALLTVSNAYGDWGVDLGVIKVGGGGVEVRNPEEAVKATIEIVNPVAHIEKAAEIIEKNTGGDVSKIAGDIRRETGNAAETMSEMGGAAVTVTESAFKDPKRGLPRLMACMSTACLSEVQAKKQMKEQEDSLRAERQAQLDQFKANKTAEERAQVEASYVLVQQKLAEVESQIEVFLGASTALINIETALDGRSELNEQVRAQVASISTSNNQQILNDYVAHIAKLDSDEAGSAEFAHRGSQLESNVAESAQAAQMTSEEFLQRVSEGLSDSQAESLSELVRLAKTSVLEVYSFLETEKQGYLAEIEGYKSALGLQ